jgi:transcriptional regulator with XRE-family HTH domain
MSTTPTDPPVGRVLRELRIERELTQESLAAKAKVHRNFVSALERGHQSPSFSSVRRLLRVLGVSWTELGALLDRAEHDDP